MKIIVTGSLGHIGSPLTRELVAKGHSVTVISSNPEKQVAIESLGARAAIGKVEDSLFLKEMFLGADAVYCMTPPNFLATDQIEYYEQSAKYYADAIRYAGVKRVVYLSSYGADLPSGTGFIEGSYKAEQVLNAITGISLTYIRPGYFYYNLLGFISMIKSLGFMGTVYGEADKLAMVSPMDIADAIMEEVTQITSTNGVRYVYSDDRTCNEVAAVLGTAIGIPELKWQILAEEQVMQALLANGLSENAAMNLIALGNATHSGILRTEFEKYRPGIGKVSLEDFAIEFASVYNQ
jgi:uncharacterized protein YbjT (DUF2867 family)